jgi:hypothetical protein
VLAQVPTLMLTASDIHDGKAGNCAAAADDLLHRITNYSTLVAATDMQPLLLQLQLIIKKLQSEDAYIVDLIDFVVATTQKIESPYDGLTGFSGTEFVLYLQLTTCDHVNCPHVEDDVGFAACQIVMLDGTDRQFCTYATSLQGRPGFARLRKPLRNG